MSSERIFNLFLYFDGGAANEYGVRHRRVAGADSEKTSLLLSHVEQDHGIDYRAHRGIDRGLLANLVEGDWIVATYGLVLPWYVSAVSRPR